MTVSDFLGGTHVVFESKPAKDGDTFYSRKGQYGVNLQVVADHHCRILFASTGYPASVHDSKAILSTPLSSQTHRYFSTGEYVLSDSAYRCEPYRKVSKISMGIFIIGPELGLSWAWGIGWSGPED
jgi:DDE superfamily endonuclease